MDKYLSHVITPGEEELADGVMDVHTSSGTIRVDLNFAKLKIDKMLEMIKEYEDELSRLSALVSKCTNE